MVVLVELVAGGCVFLFFQIFHFFWQAVDPGGALLIWLLSREGGVFVKMTFFFRVTSPCEPGGACLGTSCGKRLHAVLCL